MADLDKTIKKLEGYETKIAMFHKVGASCPSAYVRVNEETIHSVLELLKDQQQEIERLKAEHGKVIRCKECKYFQEGIDINSEHFTICECEKRTPTMTWGASVTPDWFCGHAEAKDGEQ